jgi:signal transduction histidine kinase
LITLGLYVAVRQHERFTGLCLALAGALWHLAVLDAAFPAWGPYVSWSLSGTTYMATGLAVLRYRRRRRETVAEKAFVPTAAVLTIATSVATAHFIPPAVIGYPADTFWPPIVGDPAGSTPAIVILCLGFFVLALYYCLLMARIVRAAPHISRGFLRPMALFGAFLAVGAAIVQTVSTLAPTVLGIHQAVSAVGVLILALSAALAVSMMLQQMVGSRLVAHLPTVRTPETVSVYLREATGDRTAELLYWSPETGALVDEAGRRRPLDPLPPGEQMFSTWIHGSDGERVALLIGDPCLSRDPTALASLGQVLSIIAENARLNVVLRMRVAELTATRIAEQLAFDKAREEFHRNLHDGLQQTIAAVRMDVDGLHDVMMTPDGHNVVSDMERKLTLALEQVHSLRKGSNPPELRFGLKPAIDRIVAQLRLAADCQVSDADLGILTLPVYYLVRESLTNVHKHARATNVDIVVTTDGRTIDVIVRDDGAGSATDHQHGGIRGMRRRVEELGGRLATTSPLGGGTTVWATIPCVSA